MGEQTPTMTWELLMEWGSFHDHWVLQTWYPLLHTYDLRGTRGPGKPNLIHTRPAILPFGVILYPLRVHGP